MASGKSLLPRSPAVIPAKAGIQTISAKPPCETKRERRRATKPFSLSPAVIPAKAGIQTSSVKPPIRDQGANGERQNPSRFLPPSFLRKRESRRLQSSRPSEIKARMASGKSLLPRYPPVIPAKAGNPEVGERFSRPKPSVNGKRQIPSPSLPPRHSRESGNPEVGERLSRPKPSMNGERQIPSPLTGEG